jgi:hypothetical protein
VEWVRRGSNPELELQKRSCANQEAIGSLWQESKAEQASGYPRHRPHYSFSLLYLGLPLHMVYAENDLSNVNTVTDATRGGVRTRS